MIVQATIHDYLMRQAAEVAGRENTTVDSIISIALSSQVTRNRQRPWGGWKIRQSWKAVLPAGSIARGKKAGQWHGSPLPRAQNWALD